MSWEAAKAIMGDERILLGPQASYQWRHDPKHLLFVLARYKHAARLIGDAATVLEVGCGEGIGAGILAQGRRYVGIDPDASALEIAADLVPGAEFWPTGTGDLGRYDPDPFDAAVALDVIEHSEPELASLFVRQMADCLDEDGICVIGTPNATAAAYQSETSRVAHVGLLDAEHLTALLGRYFGTVQLFGMNDEVLHTGFLPMAHYLLGVGIGPRCATD